MICDVLTTRFTATLSVLCACILTLAGCDVDLQKVRTETDDFVYSVIDRKWDEKFGVKSNYKISDTTPLHNDIQVERSVTSGVLTLPQAVAVATANNREYQLAKESLYTTALDQKLLQHEFETHFFSGARQGYGKEGGSEGIGGEADIGFSRLFASGARIGTKVGLAWFKVLTGDVRGGLASILSATLTQPLLRGSNQKVVMENLTQAERDTLYQIRSFNRFRKTFVVSVITEYYRILWLADTVKNANENCRTLDRVYGRVEKLAAVGRIPKEELEQVRQKRLQATDILALAEKDYKQALDEFKFWWLSVPVNAEFQLDVNELEALSVASKPAFSETDVVETALALRLDVANKADAIQDAERKVEVAADGLQGELNLFAGVDATSLAGSSKLPGVGVLDDDFAGDRNRPNPLKRLRDNSPLRNFLDQSEIGIDLELPLDRVAEQNIYRKALITLNQRRREYEEMVDCVTLEVRQAHRNLMETMQRYKLQSESLELAVKRLENTDLLLQYGRASSRRVLNAQDDLFDARNAATEALVGYNTAMLNFYRDTGVLQVRPDGMWQTGEIAGEKTLSADLPLAEGSLVSETEEKNLGSEEIIRLWMAKTKTKYDNK